MLWCAGEVMECGGYVRSEMLDAINIALVDGQVICIWHDIEFDLGCSTGDTAGFFCHSAPVPLAVTGLTRGFTLTTIILTPRCAIHLSTFLTIYWISACHY